MRFGEPSGFVQGDGENGGEGAILHQVCHVLVKCGVLPILV